MSKVRVFISFDMDHDEDLRNLLVGQAKNPVSPFEISDWSLREQLSGDWKEKIRIRIRNVSLVCVICGEHMDTATGVSAELKIAQEEGIPYFLLHGRTDKSANKPNSAKDSDKIYEWSWPNLQKLINGAR